MKKRLISMAVAAAVAAPLAVQADDVEVRGFTDIIYTVTNDANSASEKSFGADSEVDFIASPADGVTARIDLDLGLGTGASEIEQAMFAWNIGGGPVTLVGGVFNNPMGADEEDAPDINFTTHSAVFNILDHQTTLNTGNNVAGVAVAAGTGIFTGTLAYLNDIGGVAEENSIAVIIGLAPTQDIDLEFGYVTQDGDTFGQPGGSNGVGNVWDINGTWNSIAGSGFQAGFDYLAAAEVVDAAWNVWAGFEFGQGFAVRGRYESVALDLGAADDPSKFALYGSWQARSNLLIALEYGDGDSDGAADAVTGINDGKLVTVEFIATLP